MKKLIFLAIALLICSSAFSQSTKWSALNYSFSKGPVSPEFQHSYIITINETGAGKLSYTHASSTNDYDFSVGKKGLKNLNKALKKSKVFTVSPEDMKSENNLMGGPERSLMISMWQEPNLDQKPPTIQIPSHVSPVYSVNIIKLYDTIEKLVPADIWVKAQSK